MVGGAEGGAAKLGRHGFVVVVGSPVLEVAVLVHVSVTGCLNSRPSSRLIVVVRVRQLRKGTRSTAAVPAQVVEGGGGAVGVLEVIRW